MKEYIVTEVIDYAVQARSPEHACQLITNSRKRDKLCVQVSDRYARLAVRVDGDLTNLTDVST